MKGGIYLVQQGFIGDCCIEGLTMYSSCNCTNSCALLRIIAGSLLSRDKSDNYDTGCLKKKWK